MPPSPEAGRWLAAHLFFDGWIYDVECDRVVLDVAEPFYRRCLAEGWTDGHFFIRYSELGPHVRFRLHGDTEVLEKTVWPALQEHARGFNPEVSFEAPPLPDPPYRIPQGGDGRLTHVALIEYEPETERYGGPEAVLLAERLFEHSSEAAYALLKKTGKERSSRLGKGLLSMVVLIHPFVDSRTRGMEFAQNYGHGYLRSLVRDEDGREAWLGAFDSGYEQQADTLVEYVNEVWARLDEGESLSEALDAWAAGVREVRDRFRELFDAGLLSRGPEMPLSTWELAVQSIVSSYVHMMNNRLGITIQEEAYLAYLIARAMEKPAEEAAGAL